MNKMIKKNYELMHSPIVTPYNLLENAKLDNYSYVSYYKGETGLIAEMKCYMDDGVDTIFYYYFDKDDKLIKVYEEIKENKIIVFDRENELSNLKGAYIRKKE